MLLQAMDPSGRCCHAPPTMNNYRVHGILARSDAQLVLFLVLGQTLFEPGGLVSAHGDKLCFHTPSHQRHSLQQTRFGLVNFAL